jgi:hypothetical protein
MQCAIGIRTGIDKWNRKKTYVGARHQSFMPVLYIELAQGRALA